MRPMPFLFVLYYAQARGHVTALASSPGGDMAEYLNQNQVLEHLGLKDYRTLKRWCKETSPVIEPRQRQGYGPSRWYTGTQVRKLEKVAEAHGRAVRRPVAEEEIRSEESTQSVPLASGESTQDALSSSLLSRLVALEDKIDGLGLPEDETLTTLIQKEVKRQIQARMRVAKVSMQSSSEESEAHSNNAE